MRVTAVTIQMDEGQLLDSSAIDEFIAGSLAQQTTNDLTLNRITKQITGTCRLATPAIPKEVLIQMIADHLDIDRADLHVSERETVLMWDEWADEWVISTKEAV